MVQFPRGIETRITERKLLMISGDSGDGCRTQLPRDKILVVQKLHRFPGVKIGMFVDMKGLSYYSRKTGPIIINFSTVEINDLLNGFPALLSTCCICN